MTPLDVRKQFTIRGKDCHGYGHFGASRGARRHNGIDVVSTPGQQVLSCSDGVISKIGYPYADDLSYRYVEVDTGVYRERWFYCTPAKGIELGKKVKAGDVIGITQDLCCRYKDICQHLHLEIKDRQRKFVDPIKYIEALR